MIPFLKFIQNFEMVDYGSRLMDVLKAEIAKDAAQHQTFDGLPVTTGAYPLTIPVHKTLHAGLSSAVQLQSQVSHNLSPLIN